MRKHLHVDIETYSSVDLRKSGVYKYADSVDFEILCLAFSYGNGAEVYAWEDVPEYVLKDLEDPNVVKLAHNAAFERVCFMAVGLDVGNEWVCTAVLASYNGLPLSLKGVSEALDLGDQAKSSAGAALIRYFCVPCKPTKTNGGRHRNLPSHDTEKWYDFMEYCRQDVVAEEGVFDRLSHNLLPDFEQHLYQIDQLINDNGITVDRELVKSVLHLNRINRARLIERAKDLTGLSNPNSIAQLQNWIEDRTGKKLPNLTKGTLADLSFEDEQVNEMIAIRQRLSRTSIKKYDAMLNCIMSDNKVRGLFQFYGAHTGRWAGRLIQLQNLPRNYIRDLDCARQIVKHRDFDLLQLLFDDVQDVLAQLVRTAFIPSTGSTHLTMSDYSAIEARVLAWIAGEEWRMEVFRAGQKDIYKESASRMFRIPLEEITAEDRAKGKVSELALGFQGGYNALKKMGGEKMGLSITEMKYLVGTWRKANPAIVDFWNKVQNAATKSIRLKKKVRLGALTFRTTSQSMTIELPSGRTLSYHKARIGFNEYGSKGIQYMWVHPQTRKWSWVDSYGGKLTENIVQAIARDFMAEAIVRSYEEGLDIAMHVHDEIVTENSSKEELEGIMKILPAWAQDFPLEAKGDEVKYFQK